MFMPLIMDVLWQVIVSVIEELRVDWQLLSLSMVATVCIVESLMIEWLIIVEWMICSCLTVVVRDVVLRRRVGIVVQVAKLLRVEHEAVRLTAKHPHSSLELIIDVIIILFPAIFIFKLRR